MNAHGQKRIVPTLIGHSVELQPLQPGHRQALLDAAADGELWLPCGPREVMTIAK
jgi:hypothetical protein